MKKIYSLLILFSLVSFSQNKFLPGYYVDNANNKVECLIKNYDWKNNPTSFETKKNETDVIKTVSLTEAKEFEISNETKYIRETLEIDTSSDNIQNITSTENPIFEVKSVYLKVLIDGKNSLYKYENADIPARFFYKTEGGKIKQLIYKKYYADGQFAAVSTNQTFRKQLYSNIRCPETTIKEVENLRYELSSLLNYVNKINFCQGDVKSVQIENVKKAKFNFKPTVNLNNSSFNLDFKNGNVKGNYDMGTKFNVGFGAEIEIILPFNNDNWSVFIEPTYNSYKSDIMINIPFSTNPNYEINVKYNYIQIPLGVRRNINLNSNSKLFLNLAVNARVGMDSYVNIQREKPIDLSGGSINLNSGLGYQFKNVSIAFNHYTNTNLNNESEDQSVIFKNINFNLKYTF